MKTPIAELILSMVVAHQHAHSPELQDEKEKWFRRLESHKEALELAIAAAASASAEQHAEESDLAGPVPRAKVPGCPHQKILALWAEVLPELPQHTQWTETRRKHLQARWRETAVQKKWESEEQGLHYFRRLFGYLKQSDFLMGRAASQGRRTFTIELEWLINPSNWAKVVEGKYHA